MTEKSLKGRPDSSETGGADPLSSRPPEWEKEISRPTALQWNLYACHRSSDQIPHSNPVGIWIYQGNRDVGAPRLFDDAGFVSVFIVDQIG